MFVAKKGHLGRMGNQTVGNRGTALKLIRYTLHSVQYDDGDKTRLYHEQPEVKGLKGIGKKETR